MNTIENILKERKGFKIAGLVLAILGVAVALPIEYSTAELIVEFPFTWFFLISATVMLMYGFMGEAVAKGLLLLFLSAIIGAVIWFFFSPIDALWMFMSFWVGFPLGLLAGIIFLILDGIFLRKAHTQYKLLKQILLYIVVMALVCVVFPRASDWLPSMGFSTTKTM